MSDGVWLTKGEVNSLYYNTVAGEITFATEAQWGYHPGAVARLISRHAESLGKREIRILEIGANNCIFAYAMLDEVRKLVTGGASGLARIDYLAVEFARGTLEGAANLWKENGMHVRRGPPAPLTGEPPARPAIVAFVTGDEPLRVNLGLIHAEANQFVRSTDERFDFVILNELLDDMPYRAYYTDPDGAGYEAVAAVRAEDDGWRVKVEPRPLAAGELEGLAPSSVVARSPECVELVSAIPDLLGPGGMLLLHDYGFAEPSAELELYSEAQPSVPAFVSFEFPGAGPDGFPRSFFRIFANEACKVVQVTNDVAFAELTAALEGRGEVTILPHGGMIAVRGEEFAKGDGVFLSEFSLLEPGDDLPALLARLNADQAELRERYFDRYMAGRRNGFLDLIFVKDGEPTGT